MSPVEQVLARLALQKWAVDFRDLETLADLYTADCEQVLLRRGPEGTTEVNRARGREEILAPIVAGWERTAATWFPGASIHQVGTCVPVPLDDATIRCRSYATYLGLDESGSATLRGYLTYDDLWVDDGSSWRLARRESCAYGIRLATED